MERCCVTSRAPQPSGLQDPSIPSRAVGLNSMSKSRDAFPAWPGCCARTPLDQIRRASNAAIGPPRPPSSPPRQPVHAVAARLLSSAMRSQSPRPRLAGDAALSWQCIRPVRSKTTASPLISWLFFFFFFFLHSLFHSPHPDLQLVGGLLVLTLPSFPCPPTISQHRPLLDTLIIYGTQQSG